MPSIEERLEAITHTLELVSQMQLRTEQGLNRTEQIVNLLAADQAKTERVMKRLATMVVDHEQRLQDLE
jgi:hypothetical protein